MTAPALVSPFDGGDQLTRTEAGHLAAVVKALSDPARLILISQLHHRGGQGATVGQLEQALGHLTSGTVAHHVRVLAGAGLVTRERVGNLVVCRLDQDRMAAVAAALNARGRL